MASLPVESEDDVLAVWPTEYKNKTSAPVRDAVIAADAAMMDQVQSDAAYAADQSNIARATTRYLDGHGEDRTVARSGKEKDNAYRARILGIPALVTPEAIMDAVNAILAPYTSIKAQYLESIQDRAYLRFVPAIDGSDPQGGACPLMEATPNYPERLYPEDVTTNGAARRQCSPGGLWLFRDHVGRYFVLRVPDLSELDQDRPVLYPVGTAQAALGRIFLTDPSTPSPSYLYNSEITALGVYGAIASAVNSIVGHSIRWMMVSDPNLQ